MRITEIEIKNFRAFYGPCPYRINLHESGKNLLIYGENGSGKSSLYRALELFLESTVSPHQFENNIFAKDDESGYIKLCLWVASQSEQRVYEWSKTVKETDDLLITEASKSKGFLDYKTLLETHYIQHKEKTVNIFDLLVDNLLADIINYVTKQSFADDWSDLEGAIPRRNTEKQVKALEERIQNFNNGLSDILKDLKSKASEILDKFEYNVALDFDFQGITYNRTNKKFDNQQILLTVKFFDRDIPVHHRFLNEAKLSAIAIAISFASFLLQPESELKILALDDVLIGLDMSNRLPIIDILEEYFSDYQIFFMTYDRAWYEIVKQRTKGKEWKYAEFYFSKTDEYEIPIYRDDQTYLEKANEYFDNNDYKACAIYLRTAFEVAIKNFCDKKRLLVNYRKNPKRLTSEDFWAPIKNGKDKSGNPFLQESLINEIELYRSIILNPLSHATIVNTIKKEIYEANGSSEEN